MAGAITLEVLEKWMKYTGCGSDAPKAYGTAKCPLIEGDTCDEEYLKFARMLVRNAIGQAIHTLSQPNTPISTYKLAYTMDMQLEFNDDLTEARVSSRCCGPTCEECRHSLRTA